MNNLLKHGVTAAKGFAMGAANVVPGVSGGTIALLTGIFHELVESLDAIMTPRAWKLLLKGRFKEFMQLIHGGFLLSLGIGVIASVFTLAKLMEYVLAHYPVQTWAFFLGLILVSAAYLFCEIEGKKASDYLWAGVGAVIGIAICLLSPSHTTDSLWFIGICGAIAVCTMILPGISGSFILVLLGKYDFIMGAVSNLDIPVLAVFAAGCGLGILAFSKFLNWLLGRYEKQTLSVLIGFTLGALVKVWPWADMEACRAANLLTGNPVESLHIWPAVAWMIAGAAAVFALESLGNKRKKSNS